MKDDKFVTNTITLKDASIFCRNFLGVKSEKNSSGSRNFLVEIPEEIVDDLLDDDWNVKRSKRDNEDGTPSYYMPVEVSYQNDKFIPSIYRVLPESKIRVLLTEDTIGTLDSDDILKVDITIRPRNWFDMGHNHRVKAYVKTMFVTVMEDPLEIDYADIPIK